MKAARRKIALTETDTKAAVTKAALTKGALTEAALTEPDLAEGALTEAAVTDAVLTEFCEIMREGCVRAVSLSGSSLRS